MMDVDTITPEEMDRIDQNSEKLGVPRILLMENAGRAIAEHLKANLQELAGKVVVIVAGTGNNGGDGFVAARHLAGYGADVRVILLGHEGGLKTEEASLNWRALKSMKKTVRLLTLDDPSFEESMGKIILSAGAIVDAIFGTGIKGKLREPYSSAIDLINRSDVYTVSVDIPSGLDPLTGEVHDKVVQADATVTFHKAKVGLLKRREAVGEIAVAPIGIPPEAEEGASG